ncbi:MAG: EutN/CcmL family microcompartment protein [Solirubrobacterales bacterium]
MEIAEVLGSVTATVKAESLASHKLLVVRPRGADPSVPASVAVDTVGAGPGDLVLTVAGSAARQAPATRSVVTDLAVVAIVDSVDVVDASAPQAKRQKSKRS